MLPKSIPEINGNSYFWTMEQAHEALLCKVSSLAFLKWAAAWQNQQNDLCAQQRLRSARVFAVRMKKHRDLSYPLSTVVLLVLSCCRSNVFLTSRIYGSKTFPTENYSLLLLSSVLSRIDKIQANHWKMNWVFERLQTNRQLTFNNHVYFKFSLLHFTCYCWLCKIFHFPESITWSHSEYDLPILCIAF